MAFTRVNMGKIWVIMVMITLFALMCLTCASSVSVSEIHEGLNNNSSNENPENVEQRSQGETMTLRKRSSNTRTPSHGTSQSPLTRSSRTVLHKPLLNIHSKNKHKFDPLSHMKKHKSGLLSTLFKLFGGCLEGFMIEIEKVLNWFNVIIKNLKKQSNDMQIPLMQDSNIAIMDREFPKAKNKILELLKFIFGYFNFGRNADHQFPSGKICTDVKGSLNKIKNMASSLIMLFKESQLMDSYSNENLAKIQSYFESMPVDQCSILEYGLTNGYGGVGWNEKLNDEPNHNKDADIFTGQTHMLEVMWKFMNQLPVIFEMIFELLGKLWSNIQSEPTTHEYNAPSHFPPQVSGPPMYDRPSGTPSQRSYWSKFGDSNGYMGYNSPGIVGVSQKLKSCPQQVILNGMRAKAFMNLKNTDKGSDVQLVHKAPFPDIDRINQNCQGGRFHHISAPLRDSANTKFSMELSTVMYLLKAQQLSVGDIVILNLTDDIILVGKVDNGMARIIFNVIHRGTTQGTSHSYGTSIWNLSYKDLSSNQQIYDSIWCLTNLQTHT